MLQRDFKRKLGPYLRSMGRVRSGAQACCTPRNSENFVRLVMLVKSVHNDRNKSKRKGGGRKKERRKGGSEERRKNCFEKEYHI